MLYEVRLKMRRWFSGTVAENIELHSTTYFISKNRKQSRASSLIGSSSVWNQTRCCIIRRPAKREVRYAECGTHKIMYPLKYSVCFAAHIEKISPPIFFKSQIQDICGLYLWPHTQKKATQKTTCCQWQIDMNISVDIQYMLPMADWYEYYRSYYKCKWSLPPLCVWLADFASLSKKRKKMRNKDRFATQKDCNSQTNIHYAPNKEMQIEEDSRRKLRRTLHRPRGNDLGGRYG